MYYLSSCSIVKNEDNYIDEFVRIHQYLGVEFFLFFDRSNNPLSNKFKNLPHIKVINFPEGPNGMHANAWMEGVKFFTGKTKWCQFVDIDQVVVPKQTNDIKVMLQNYENHASLGLNWHSFGSSHRETEPEEGLSTYEAYTLRAADETPINNHIQSIVQPDKIEHAVWHDPHHPIVKPGERQVNSIKMTCHGPFNIPPYQEIGFIAHYYTRSREYWARKIAKRRADTNTIGGTLEDFDHHQTYMNAVEDLTVKNIWDKCK